MLSNGSVVTYNVLNSQTFTTGFLNSLNNYKLSTRCRQTYRLYQSYKQKEKASIK